MSTFLRPRTRFERENYCGATLDSTRVARRDPRVTLSLVRIAFREHHRPTWGIRASITPTIIGLRVTRTPDRWGNRIFGSVAYDDEGHLATYGGRVENGRIVWQCYMD